MLLQLSFSCSHRKTPWLVLFGFVKAGVEVLAFSPIGKEDQKSDTKRLYYIWMKNCETTRLTVPLMVSSGMKNVRQEVVDISVLGTKISIRQKASSYTFSKLLQEANGFVMKINNRFHRRGKVSHVSAITPMISPLFPAFYIQV